VNVWQAKGYRGPYRIIPQFGVDPTLFQAPPNRDSGRSFVIGSAGRRLVPEKGVDLLLKAASRLGGVWRLHIAGDGPERQSLEQLASKLGVRDRVYFDGVIPSDQMPSYLRQLDVLVLSSRTLSNWKEQFGRVLVEAMACEVAVVGSDSGEIPSVIGSAGLTFPENNADALHQHLLSLQQDESLLSDLRKAGRCRVLKHYTQEHVAAQTVDIYRTMMADG
jgi:glycosyltransferase involved in cell wall biosynthesis